MAAGAAAYPWKKAALCRGRREGPGEEDAAMPDAIVQFFTTVNRWAWSWPTIALLLGTHLFLTVRT